MNVATSFLIAYSRPMAGKKSDLGPIGENVTQTLRKFREMRRFGYADLSRKLAQYGREIPPLGLRRIESGERRVDVDDLAALAVALNVSPLALLLPMEDSRVLPADEDAHASDEIWRWGRGFSPLGTLPGEGISDSDAPIFAFVQASNPNPSTDLGVDIEELKSLSAAVAKFTKKTGPRGDDK
jgi:transcriptional regulator with XRE-family HTH domain